MKVYKLTIGSINCAVDDIDPVMEIIKELDIGDNISITISEMTEEEYNNLPEFQGF